jgi:hypothetical protein
MVPWSTSGKAASQKIQTETLPLVHSLSAASARFIPGVMHRNIPGFFPALPSRAARQMHRLLRAIINRFSTGYPLTCQPVVIVIARGDLSAVAQRAKAEATKQSTLLFAAPLWIASRSLSSGAHSRDPVARNDDPKTLASGCLKIESEKMRSRRDPSTAVVVLVIARSEATKQSIVTFILAMDCFAALAMTRWARCSTHPNSAR